MKRSRWLLFLITTLLLSSCSIQNTFIRVVDLDSKYITNNNYLKEIDEGTIVSKLDSKNSFIVLQYSTSCSTCLRTLDTIHTYQKNNNVLIYGYVPSDNYSLLVDSYPTIFATKVVYPLLYLFKEGKLVKEIRGDNNIYNSLKPVIHSFTYSNNVYSLSFINSFNQYLSEYKSSLIMLLNDSEKIQLSALNYFMQYKNSSTNLLYIETKFIEEEFKEYLNSEYKFKNNEIIYLEGNNIKSSYNYQELSIDSIKEYLNNLD